MPEPLSKIKRLQRELMSGFQDRWSGENEETLSFGEKFIRFWAFVGRSFNHNRLPVRAAALTYATLLALVPLLAVAISIATALLKTEEGQKQVSQQIEELIDNSVQRFAPQLDLEVKQGENNRQQVTSTIRSSITNIQSGKLGIAAMIALVFIAISLLSSIEHTLNDIWGIKRGRSWLSKIIQYWAVITLGPVLVLAGITFSAKRNLELSGWVPGADVMNGLMSEFVPMLVFTVLLFIVYRLMPNTKVETRAALVGGFVGGLLLYLNNKFSMIYFGQVANNFEIYGSLGSIPVFLVGLYFSWMILLFGAQVAYAFQNRKAYFQEKQAENINERGREFVALRIMTLVADRFANGEKPATMTQVSEQLSIPSRLVSKIVEPLLLTGLLVEVRTQEKAEAAYDPGRPLEQISYQNILDAMRCGTGQDVPTKDDDMRRIVAERFTKIQTAESLIASQINLRDLVLRPKLDLETSVKVAALP